ncbi:MAG: hypothetical protein RIM84_19675 [Alphaproteobacteria bacterium]
MQRGEGLPPIFGRVRLWARLGAVAFVLIGAVLAGPTIYDEVTNYEKLGVDVVALAENGNPIVAVPDGDAMRRVEVPELAGVDVGAYVEVHRRLDDPDAIGVVDVDRAYIIALVSLGLAWFAWGAAGRVTDADELARADQAARAGVGDEVVMESHDTESGSGLLRAVSVDRLPPRPALSKLTDEVVDNLGGSGLAISVTICTWIFFCILVVGFQGVFQGHALSFGGIVALVAATAIAIAIITFRNRFVLSPREGAVHKVISCLGIKHRRSRSLDEFERVALVHLRVRTSTVTKNRVSSSTNDHFKVLLRGADDELELADYRSPFLAHTRAQQLATYLGLPYDEPAVTNPADVKLYKP